MSDVHFGNFTREYIGLKQEVWGVVLGALLKITLDNTIRYVPNKQNT